MSTAFLAQPEQQQTLEWLDGGTFSVLLDSQATEGQLTVGRFDVAKGEAPPFHMHTREDEIFMLIKGEALLWLGEERMELSEGGIVYLPKNIPHGYRITSDTADLLVITTPGGIEGMFRQAGHDVTTPRPKDFAITPERLAESAEQYGQITLGPPH
ncbi:cupin domain-containing protein [Streptomyces scopuliridis]|uniref:Cupin domain-containing protein n=1 Tax=Streptomyces scopuliridis TaxID=452529 RepID=A0ACD4ZC13_9ACTN|nr:cupin domain-containing protein [Streptomyces scopuliridis]WSB95802.1 cupin domain-containing protein [Streptomyces scopuliridis]WSC10491.1 cupin domain-containing protein [Streptomyces scopuliridis]